MTRALISMLLVVCTGSAQAQVPVTPQTPINPEREGEAAEAEAGAEAEQTDTEETPVLTPARVNAASCLPLDLTPGALIQSVTTREIELATPIPWTEFEIEGQLVDKKEVVHALLEPTLQQLRTSLSTATLPQVAALTARFGYQLVGHRTLDTPTGTKLILFLAPLPLVRFVEVKISQKPWDKLLDDEVRRRMGIRAGSYLPWEPIRRQCALLDERRRILEFLFDEGYFDADVEAYAALDRSSATIHVKVKLGTPYEVGNVRIACPPGFERRKGVCTNPTTNVPYTLKVPEAEIKELFEHQRCVFGESWLCIGPARFTRAQHQEDLQRLRELFQLKGFPAVRITSSDPAQSINRNTKRVNPVLTIDQRRQIDVKFEGHDPDVVSEDQLRRQLTFNDAGSADDVENGESARALTTFLQTRGYFDARVTWYRERIDIEPRPGTTDVGVHYDNIVFQITTGRRRRVRSVEFVSADKRKPLRALRPAQLQDLVATKEAKIGGSFLGTTLAATSPELIADQERIKEAYRRAGHLEARVGTSASPSRAGLDNAALTVALLGVDDGNELHVRFTIDEGPPTLLTRIVVQLEGGSKPDDALCAEALGALASQLGAPQAALPTTKKTCTATLTSIKFRVDDVAATRDGLREALFKNARARARVEYQPVPIGPQRMEARYTLKDTAQLRLGTVVIRGNFRTKNRVIYDQLDFDEGQLLTTDRIAEGARRLRTMGLFEAVNLDMPDLDCDGDLQCGSEVINAVVRVEERYDHKAEVAVEAGFSSVNGLFATLRPTMPNITGRGLRFELSGTYGQKLKEAEARFRIPPYFVEDGDFPLTVDLTGLYREQDTPRFGVLTTQGASVALSKIWNRPRTPTRSARAHTLGPYYEFRLRSRNVDALRPIGADMDESQVAISTRTGLVGLRYEYENRVDRVGQLAPFAPENGVHAIASASFAQPWLGGQNFVKLSAGASRFIPIGKRANDEPIFLLRADARYDHGMPLGGAVLLPEVERFFGGGDDTVRGYADDRLSTELIEVGVPPLGNVTQIRVIPAGGNIRALASLDGQVRIWKLLAGALFTDAGLITNEWTTVTTDDIRPSVGMGLRALTPFGIGALEYAIPLRPQLGDDPRGRIHFYFAARAQF